MKLRVLRQVGSQLPTIQLAGVMRIRREIGFNFSRRDRFCKELALLYTIPEQREVFGAIHWPVFLGGTKHCHQQYKYHRNFVHERVSSFSLTVEKSPWSSS